VCVCARLLLLYATLSAARGKVITLGRDCGAGLSVCLLLCERLACIRSAAGPVTVTTIDMPPSMSHAELSLDLCINSLP
jgi:hypothetical protein